ncbi:transporter substrate-binding domain-containing protein [Stenotrophomonas sp. 278]|uniref:ATP-binding protein n=1 Tax=Stenotrophomonas sp. 278 TaxID=2479851 RepID=UPI000F66B628|nr:transporter substrate-binding domain-containing protein [Stenotrophomonas sp. 278]RRU11922.1 response regulator [Stenotrophomonas sp. 278]
MRTSVVRWLLVLVLLITASTSGNSAPGTLPAAALSPRQAEWIERNPTILLGLYDSGWPPYESVQNGEPKGLGYDYLMLLSRQLGLDVQVRVYRDWAEVLDAACRGEVDVVMNIALTPGRTRCMVYTSPYAEAPLALVGRPGDTRASADPDLTGLRVVTEQEFLTSEQIRSRFPGARRVVASNTAAALEMVAQGKADIYIGNAHVANAIISDRKLEGITLLRPSDLPPERLHFGVPNARQPLAEALDAALATLPDSQRDIIAKRWITPLQWSAQSRLVLSEAESRVLATPLRMGYAPQASPLSFVDASGEPSGVAGDYLRQLRMVGAQLNRVPAHDWFEVRDQMRRGTVDVVMGMPNDAHYLGDDWVFSQPFISVPNVVVTPNNSRAVLGLSDLDGRTILLSDPDRLRGYILQYAPKARIVPARSVEQALARLANGDADAYVGNLAMVDRVIREFHPARLHVAAPAGFSDQLSLAVKRQYAPLATTFDRVLTNLTPREHAAIRGDWLLAEYRSGLDWRSVARWAVPLSLILLTAMIVHGWGYLRLRREVSMRRGLEKRLAEITDNLPAIVYQARRESDGRVTFPYITGDLHSMFGVSTVEVMRDDTLLEAQIDARDREAITEAMTQAARNFTPLDLEFRTSPHGVVRWVRTRALPYATADGAVLWSGYWVDVTEARAQADALAAAKSDAERATAAKSNFLATMSHEIRTPMSGVLGMVEALSHTKLDGEQRRIIGVIEDSAQMLRQILDDILDYSRIEAGALPLEPQPVALRSLLDNVQQLLSPQASSKGLDLSLEVDPDVAAQHLVDGMRLRQVVFNLLSNAIKFTNRGRVGIALKVERSDDMAQTLRLTVTDTGIGISPEQRERLFKPFAQADVAITRHYGGTGLGLSICQRLVGLMRGRLDMHSIPGQGTRVDVVLSLPRVPGGDGDADVQHGTDGVQPLPSGQARRRVLVVEDHPTNQALMRWRLQQLGLQHELAVDGEAALALLDASSFDLVITDCRMPVMDGYTLTRRIRERERGSGRHLPILALTASALAEDLQRCREAGMDDLLAKPVALATLRRALRRWLPSDPDDDGPTATDLDAGNPATPATPPTRKAIVERFGSEHVATVLIESMRKATGEDLQRGLLAREQNDSNAAVEVLHRIVGGLGTLGAESLATQARGLMQQIQNQGVAACVADIAAFEESLEAYLHSLDR